VRLAAEGALVVVHGTRQTAVADVADTIAATRHAGEEIAQAALAAAGGHLDIVVNNAALMTGALSTAASDPELVELALRTNIAAPIAIVRKCVVGMVERGDGVIVNVGSVNGEIGMAGFALYGATKGAVHALTRAWASEDGAHGVRVVTVAPGPTYTERSGSGSSREHIERLTNSAPSGRPVTTDEVAATVAFVVSADASGITGTVIAVDGGYLAV
jgi:NAD(P)-dependent dehydrogenase (short-subunit alcohol dehydrogenase family)